MSVWKNNPDLMERLGRAQNSAANVSCDILTFAGFCSSREELERHVVHYEDRAAAYVAPVRGRRKAA